MTTMTQMFANLGLPRWAVAGLVLPVLFLNLWLLQIPLQYLQPIPTILVVACLLSFLLNFPISYLERRGVSRIWSVSLVLLLAVAALLVLGFGVVPILYQQLIEFGDRLPTLVTQGQQQLQNLQISTPLEGTSLDVSKIISGVTNQVAQGLEALPSQVVDVIFGVFDSTLNLLLTFVLTILFIFDGASLWAALFKRLPQPWNAQVPSLIQQSFQNYFAGQATLAMIQSCALSLLFLTFQIPFGLLFGIVIGMVSFIPFGGSVAIALILPILAIQNVWLAVKVLVIAVLVGQINDNVIAPRLMSKMTGVSPTVIFISLLCGAKLGGILGILFAVPGISSVKKIAESFFRPGSLEAASELEIKLQDPTQSYSA